MKELKGSFFSGKERIEMKLRVRRIVAIIMLILLIINSLPLSSFAAFITDINSNAEFGVVSGSLG